MPPAFRTTPVRVRAPATSANLGPAFDCAGLALALHDTVQVRVTGPGLSVDVEGEGAGRLPRSERHLLVRALRAAFDRLGGQPAGLEVRCANRIPQGRGLGSSAAAIVAGVTAARALVVENGSAGGLDDAAALDLATALEGHPDNVAACLLGGLTLTWTTGEGARAVRLDPSPELAPVVFVPSSTASTRSARAALPQQVPHDDAAANASRSALLAHAITTDLSLLHPATEDRLHQQYRAPGQPATAALVAQLRDDGVAAAVSGSGPSVVALTSRAERAAVAGRRAAGWTVLALDVEPTGACAGPAG